MTSGGGRGGEEEGRGKGHPGKSIAHLSHCDSGSEGRDGRGLAKGDVEKRQSKGGIVAWSLFCYTQRVPLTCFLSPISLQRLTSLLLALTLYSAGSPNLFPITNIPPKANQSIACSKTELCH